MEKRKECYTTDLQLPKSFQELLNGNICSTINSAVVSTTVKNSRKNGNYFRQTSNSFCQGLIRIILLAQILKLHLRKSTRKRYHKFNQGYFFTRLSVVFSIVFSSRVSVKQSKKPFQQKILCTS